MARHEGLTTADALRLLGEAGYSGTVLDESGNTAAIEAKIHGLNFLAFLAIPNGSGRYETLQLFIGFQEQVNPAVINAWNEARRFARACQKIPV